MEFVCIIMGLLAFILAGVGLFNYLEKKREKRIEVWKKKFLECGSDVKSYAGTLVGQRTNGVIERETYFLTELPNEKTQQERMGVRLFPLSRWEIDYMLGKAKKEVLRMTRYKDYRSHSRTGGTFPLVLQRFDLKGGKPLPDEEGSVWKDIQEYKNNPSGDAVLFLMQRKDESRALAWDIRIQDLVINAWELSLEQEETLWQEIQEVAKREGLEEIFLYFIRSYKDENPITE